MVTIKEIDSGGSGKILLILYGTMGLVFGFFTTGATLLGFSTSKRSGIFSLLFGRSAVLTLPIFYGVFGYLIGVISARLYNRLIGSKKGFKVNASSNFQYQEIKPCKTELHSQKL